MSRLFIAEKPSLAEAIADGIGGKSRKDGYFQCADGDVVTWAYGHLLELCEPHVYDEEYAKWSFDHLPIIPSVMRKQIKINPKTKKTDPGALKQMKVIRALHKKSSRIVNAGDPDREGQLLIDEILDEIGNKKPVDRIWLASIDLKSTRKALGEIVSNDGFHGLRMAAEARSVSDWLVGLNMTRAITLTLKQQGGYGVISIGRVQTPTLALIVNRELMIRNFKPRDYYACTAVLSSNGSQFKADFKPEYNDNLGGDADGYLIDKSIADKALRDIETKAEVKSYASKASKTNQPLCYALSTLQKEASSKLGMGAKEVLDVAQSLYEKKLTSYPRTDCGYLPEEQFEEAADILLSLVDTVPIAAKANSSIKSPTWNTKKVGAHNGIIPTGGKASGLTSKEQGIYEMICKRFVAQFFGPQTFDQISVQIKDASGNNWKASGRNITSQGWKEVYSEPKESGIPELKNGDLLDFIKGSNTPSKTKPPARFTQGSLIEAMSSVHKFVENEKLKKMLRENSGIGTEATRGSVIETLFSRGFVEEKSKKVIPTDLGIFLIENLTPKLKDPGVTAVWEEYLKMIENNKLTYEQFIAEQSKYLPMWIDDVKQIDFPKPIIEALAARKPKRKASAKRSYKKKSG